MLRIGEKILLKPYEIQESVGVQEIELEKEKWSQNTEQVEKMQQTLRSILK